MHRNRVAGSIALGRLNGGEPPCKEQAGEGKEANRARSHGGDTRRRRGATKAGQASKGPQKATKSLQILRQDGFLRIAKGRSGKRARKGIKKRHANLSPQSDVKSVAQAFSVPSWGRS